MPFNSTSDESEPHIAWDDEDPSGTLSFSSALDALRRRDDVTVLAEYLLIEEPTPSELRALSQMLSSSSTHEFELHLKRRYAGNPKLMFCSDDRADVHKLKNGQEITLADAREVAKMMLPESSHPYRLHFRRRRRGRKSNPIWKQNLATKFKVAGILKAGGKVEAMVRKAEDFRIHRKLFFALKKEIELSLSKKMMVLSNSRK